jgi:GT2 family glycosyltransferase
MTENFTTKIADPEISVVLATKGNKTDLLEKCILSLQNQTFRNFEIILVYKIFPKQLEKLFETNNIIVLKETSPTLGAARNLGVKHARGELVAFLDDDAEAPVDWLGKIVLTFQRYSELSCLGGPHFTPKEESQKSPLRFVEGSLLEAYEQKIYTDSSAVGKIAGCNVTYKKAVFERIGYLDETLRTTEDWEFHERLAENGYHLRFDPLILVLHHRQGLKHNFLNNSNIVPFYLSRKTLKFARYESLFATFYLTNLIAILLFVILIFSPYVFALIFLSFLFGHLIFTAVRTKTYSWRVVYFPLALLLTLVRLLGFYFGLCKYVVFKLKHLHAK